MSGADRPDWAPEEEEKEEEEKEEHEKLHSGDGGGSHCGAAAEPWEGGGVLVEPARCLMGRLRVSLRASGFPFFSPTREAGAGMCVAPQALEGRGAPPRARCGRGPGLGLARQWVATCLFLAGRREAAIPRSGLHRRCRHGNVSSGSSLCVTTSIRRLGK